MNLANMLNDWWIGQLTLPTLPTGSRRFPGIREDARQLGVSAPHLWLVLSGQRVSHDLTRRYQALKMEVES